MAYRDELHYIYVMGYEGGPSKIGRSHDPERRLKEISAQVNQVVFITGLWPMGASIAFAVERYVHWYFKDRHYRREWFDVGPDDVALVVKRAIELKLHPQRLIPEIVPVGRKAIYKEHFPLRLVEGTIAKIDSTLSRDETRTDFVRIAVERELRRRSKASVSSRDRTRLEPTDQGFSS